MEEKHNPEFIFIFLILFFLVLILRLFQLQIVQGKTNRFLAENNRIRKILIPAQRGLFFDRHGEPLVQNQPIFHLKSGAEDKKMGREEALTLQAEGKEVEISLRRNYLTGEIFAHLLGYLGEVSLEELKKKKLELEGYRPGSLIGRFGVEMQYEKQLKGRDGGELVEVNTAGEIVRRINKVLPQSGKSFTLAVDRDLQEVAAGEMAGKKGAVIASRPQTGEILVLYSSPSFDPDKVVGAVSDEENLPLLNRVISGIFAPGSTFKIVTSIAGLQEGKISENSLINDPGVIVVNDYRYSNWYFTQYGKTEGEINLIKALARSTDTFFYQLGERLGEEKLISWIKKFHLDQKFGIDLPGESAGFVATPEWKQEIRGESWFLGNTYHLAIGQGDLDLTPLGVNQMTSVIASGGKMCIPRILRVGAENTPYKEDCFDLGINKENIEIVKKGMIGACSAGGTGWPFFDFQIPGLPAGRQVACKTGTAETGDGKTTHAWFTVFAPIDNPEIVLTVLVEKGGEGSYVAAPIAKEILKEYFRE
ncbi:hypothetical protein CO053_04265 [Candidatus Shapirobacteria bacterium CG_4_9_14_0_2_um_filter_40_11]|uniref:Beta-lactamase n=1 Tax=Candidatus Shapirobacteria bacterium CG_4_9_14_0_2_um_filter_40_11 TaxID=1974876 RepID=A0A2M8ETU2_9BACT|nr:MAG: hypothetical protein CO053_04265 [Candidatus Shapirobacteria bacterium CG_4_9_14_0_2_um_filter_40_11]